MIPPPPFSTSLPSPKSSTLCLVCPFLFPLGLFICNTPSVSSLLLLAALVCISFLLLRSVSHAFILSLFSSLFNPQNEPFLLYSLPPLLYLPHWPFLLPCPCQSLCEFYANHCARIEALRRQLQDEQRGRQVEHTATAGLGWYCSWDVKKNIKIYIKH